MASIRTAYVFAFFLASLLCGPTLAFSAKAPLSDEQLNIEKIGRILEEHGLLLAEQKTIIDQQEARFRSYREQVEKRLNEQQRLIESLQARLAAKDTNVADANGNKPATNGTVTVQSLLAQRATGPEGSTQPAPEKAAPPQPVGIPPEQPKEQRPPEVAPIFDQPGVLTPRGTLVLEPAFQYSNSSTKRLSLIGYTYVPAINVGYFDLKDVARDTYVASLSARYGITNRLELEMKVPYVYRKETVADTTQFPQLDIVSSSEGYGIGDVEFGLRYQINQPVTGPFFIASLRAKSDTGKGPFDVPTEILGDAGTTVYAELPTGSGFWAIQPGLSAIYPSDPAVFFGSVSYIWNIEKNVGGSVGKFDPGDVIDFNFGMGLALNEQNSFSIGYQHSIIGKSSSSNTPLDQVRLTVGSLQFGWSFKMSKSTSVSLSLAAGITDAAPDVQLTLRVPVSF
ncbi:MAG: transporter [Desulfuromonadales bacterium]|nr:MAG: transporter [Desulfuromonadales bacterium]